MCIVEKKIIRSLLGCVLCQTEGTHQIVGFSSPEYCKLFA